MVRDYGGGGRVGVGTPQANPTVEPELSRLVPRDVATYAVRLCSTAAEPEVRLREYIENLSATLRRYDTLVLDAFAFGCTGSAYLVGAEREAELVSELAGRAGYPVITATQALYDMLCALQAGRLGIIAPYPPALREAGERYWASRGFTVVRAAAVATGRADTRGIYELTSAHASAALDEFELDGLDAVVLSGTGMPTLGALERWDGALPVLSSNVALGWALCRALGRDVAASTWLSAAAPWRV